MRGANNIATATSATSNPMAQRVSSCAVCRRSAPTVSTYAPIVADATARTASRSIAEGTPAAATKYAYDQSG
jgi:hypothetical protein